MTRRQFIVNAVRATILLGVGKGFYNTSRYGIELTRVRIEIANLPPQFRGLTIAHLSDFHSSFIVSRGLIENAARLAMGERPNMIVLTGDFVSGSTKFIASSVGDFNKKYLDRCIDALGGLRAPMGIYGVLGNHDLWSGKEAARTICREFSRRLDVVWLRNSNTPLEKEGQRINLLGVDDYWEGGSLIQASRGLAPGTVKILLSHNPDINDDIELLKQEIDLVLSGHTHGGQVVLPLVGMLYIPSKFGEKYRAGLVSDGNRKTYITRGVGNLLFPFRFNCPPEVTLLTLA
ncbi:MAG: metallophosphoesterase [Thermodesulfobacteriota bacterium]